MDNLRGGGGVLSHSQNGGWMKGIQGNFAFRVWIKVSSLVFGKFGTIFAAIKKSHVTYLTGFT